VQLTGIPPSSSQMRIRIALSLLAAASVASAQTQPGVTFKVRTQLRNHPVPEKSKPDSVRIRRLEMAAAARANADVNTSGDAPPAPGRGGGGNTGTNISMVMKGSAIKGNHRMDVTGIVGDGRTELTATQWALFTDTTTTVVDDVQHMYWPRVFDIGSILAFTGQVDAQNSRVGTLKVSWDSLPAETIEGRPARHYQMKMEYGLKQQREDSLKDLAITRVTSDYWVVNLPVNFENRFAGIGRPRRLVPDSLRGEWAKMLDLYKELDKGTIVKFTAAGIIGENAGSATEYTRTMEMTDIKDAPVDPAQFKVPAEFTLRPPQGRGRGGNQ
jgi:hypothetical protein